MRKKLIYSIFCCIAAAVMVVACTKEGETPTEVLSLDQSSISLSYVGTTQPVLVSTTAAWTVTTSADWLTVTPASGVGNTTIVVAVLDNETVDARMSILTVTAGNKTGTITVSQSGMATTLPGEAGVITGLGTNDCPFTTSVDLTAEPIDGAASYVWYHNGTIIYNITGLTYTVTESGAYTYAGKNNLGLGSPSGEKRVVIEECQIPNVPVITGDNVNTCPAKTVVLTIAEDRNATSYQWYKDGNAIAGATGLTYTATANGIYTVIAANFVGESAMSDEHEVTIEKCPLNIDDLVGTWTRTSYRVTSGNAYTDNGTTTITKIDANTIGMTNFGYNITTQSIRATIDVMDALFILQYQRLTTTWNSSYQTWLAPMKYDQFCDNFELPFDAYEITKDATDRYVITMNTDLFLGTIDGNEVYCSWLGMAVDPATGACLGGFSYFGNTKWVKTTPNPIPAALLAPSSSEPIEDFVPSLFLEHEMKIQK